MNHQIGRIVLATTIATVLAPAGGQSLAAQRSKSSFEELGAYELLLDDKKAEARFFHSPALRTILIAAADLSFWIEIDPRTRAYSTYSALDYLNNKDGTKDRKATALAIALGSFDLENKLPHLRVAGHDLKLRLKPPLLGEVDREAIFAYDRGYHSRSKLHQPHPDNLSRIKQHQGDVEVRVFFGSWCATCFKMMPNILSLDQALAGGNVKFSYFGLPQGGFNHPEAKKLNVTSVPTGIIFVDGKEIRRLSGYSWQYPAMSVANALSGIHIPDVRAQPPGQP